MKKLYIFPLFIFFCFNSHSITHSIDPAQYTTSIQDVFKEVLIQKHKEKNLNIPFPEIRYESSTSITFLKKAMKEQWGFEPDQFTNAFQYKRNIIFLIDSKTYYNQQKRCMDDSLAHELTHYIQNKYQGFDLNDDSLEAEAIEIQTLVREKLCLIMP